MLTIVNPATTMPTRKGKAMAKKSKKGKMPAGLRRYWAERRKTRKNPSSKTRTKHVYHVAKPRRKVHRNPSVGGKAGIFSELMTRDGLMMVAAVVATPTLTEAAIGYVAPNLTGYTRSAAKAALGLGAAYAVHRFVNKKAGLVVGLVALGTAAAEVIRQVQAAPKSTPQVSGYIPAGSLGGYTTPYYNDGNLRDELGEDLSEDLGAFQDPGTVWI